FADGADRARVRLFLLALLLVLAAGLLVSGGWALLLAAALAFFIYWRLGPRFGGLSGDLAGWFLQTAELWMLIAMCLEQYGRTRI
ncbi:MAG: adenosylcobinamide-GDP ribazoletransferase, partial [Oscillospiraceae bacterium]|nr:adenosylcobinamide-GDP ribazoletransferase [Oscillospiraceae bacterium]